MVDIFYVRPVGQVEDFKAGFPFDALGKRNYALQAQIDIIVGVAFVGVTRTRAHPVRKRKSISVAVKSHVDAVLARALQTAEHGEFEVAHDQRPLLRRLSQEGECETVPDVVVAHRAVP